MKKRSNIIFFIGKMGVGKTTYSKQLSNQLNAIYISEDEILSSFYPDEINSIHDYVTYSSRIKPYIKELIYRLTSIGMNIVMDFPGNTLKQREWFKEIIDFCKSDHKLIYLKADDETCLNQIMNRRKEHPERHKFDNEELYYIVTSYFQKPTIEEGFNLEIILK
jgi:shikimate kinase